MEEGEKITDSGPASERKKRVTGGEREKENKFSNLIYSSSEEDMAPAPPSTPATPPSPALTPSLVSSVGSSRSVFPPVGGQKRALLVGINYLGTEAELGGCVNDVLNACDLLLNVYGYSPENILLLSDPLQEINGLQLSKPPTYANIIEGWRWLLSGSPAKDFGSVQSYRPLPSKSRLYFHYSGHGCQVEDRGARTREERKVGITKDEGDGWDEALCPLDYETAGLIVDDIIRSQLAAKVPSGCVLNGVVDACHSGSAFDLLWNCVPRGKGNWSLSKAGKYPATMGEVTLLSGCRDDQTSADIRVQGKGQGALSYALFSVLRRNKYLLECDQMLEEVRNFIREQDLSDQVPCLSFGRSANLNGKYVL